MMERTIIGLTGPSAGGKGAVAEILKGRGFTYFSLSDVLRKESNKLGWGEGRETLQNLGDALRERFGNDILPRRIVAMPEFKHADYVVIDSIRHPDEIDYLRDAFEAKIIGVTESPEKIFERMELRKRPGDPETFEEFLKMLKREEGPEGSPVMQVRKCLEMADVVIWNEGNETDLKRETEGVLREFGIEGPKASHEHMHHHH